MTQGLRRWSFSGPIARIAGFFAAALAGLCLSGAPGRAEAPDFTFRTIDGATIALSDLRGAPVLLINAAMQDGYVVQVEGVKDLARAYRGENLTIILTPRDEVEGAVSSPRALSYFYRDLHGLRLPITYPVQVEGPRAHPFFPWVRAGSDEPIRWNFNKILLNADGEVERVFGAEIWPTDRRITRMVESRIETARHDRERGEAAIASPRPDAAREAAVAALALTKAVAEAASSTAIAGDAAINGEIASAEMWPPAPAPRPGTLMREDFAAPVGPWPPAPTPRPEMRGEAAAFAADDRARKRFVLTAAD